MIEQVSNAIQFLAHFVASGTGATGLTVTVDVRKWDGTAVTTIATDAAATEIGGGLYGYSLASGSTTDEAIYTAVFKTSGTADQKHLPALWCVGKAGVEKLDATVTSRHASGAAVASVSGDVSGKVLGGGSGTISGVGARVVDGDGSAIATAASITALFTTAMTEAYPTDGSTVTPAQALYLILAHLNERTVSGTTITLKKLDGSTTAATFTINDANTPTSITRAS